MKKLEEISVAANAINRKGKKLSEEHKQNMSIAHQKRHAEGRNTGGFVKGSIPWNKGKTFSEETKEKMRQAKIGYIPWNKGQKYKLGPL